MKHETFPVLALDGIEHLLIVTGTQSHRNQCLRLSTSKQS